MDKLKIKSSQMGFAEVIEVFSRVDMEVKTLEDRIVELEQAVSDDFSQQVENEL